MRALIICLLLVATRAYAEPVVLAVDGKDIYVDIGAKDGVGAGSQLELLHEIVARDPKTGTTLRDRFALGVIEVEKSGASISVAHADDDLVKRVLPGDHVRLVSGKRSFVDPWDHHTSASKGQPAPLPISPTTPTAPAKANGPTPADHANQARDAWQDTLGQPIDKRIARWQALLTADPLTPYRKAIETEIASLQAQQMARDAALAEAKSTKTTGRDPKIAQLARQLEVPYADPAASLIVDPIARAVPGRAIELAFLMRQPSRVRTAYLYVRPDGAPGFARSELRRDGDAYLRGTIDGSAVKGDKVDWYVELASDDESAPALGSQEQPNTIEIDAIVSEAPIAQGRTHIDGHVDYVDFDGKFGGGYDQYTQAELDFTYRFLHPVHAVRLGFGTLNGKGGPKDVIDLNNHCLDESGNFRCEHVNFSYVYTEVEFRIAPSVALMIRPQAGLLTTDTMDSSDTGRCSGSDINGCEFFTGFGARGRLRLGDELGTNLVLGASFTSRIGTLLEAAYNWLPNKVVPVQITVQVTDQPVVEDFGVRLIADVGVRKVSWFYPSARLSYQARDIDHSGLSGGFALNFDW
jgi:hypothetical protein